MSRPRIVAVDWETVVVAHVDIDTGRVVWAGTPALEDARTSEHVGGCAFYSDESRDPAVIAAAAEMAYQRLEEDAWPPLEVS